MGCVALFTGGLKFGCAEAKLQEIGKLDWSTEAEKTHTNISQRRNKSNLEMWTVSSLEFTGHKSPWRHISQEAEGPGEMEDPSWKHRQNTGKLETGALGLTVWPQATALTSLSLWCHVPFMAWLHGLAPSTTPAPPTRSTSSLFHYSHENKSSEWHLPNFGLELS